jgi:O-antigen/teichoic acid export membrane protein
MSFKATLATTAVYKISNVVVLFLTTAILSRAMGVEGYGLLSLLVLNAALFNMLTSFGVDSGITYLTASDPKNINRVVGVSLFVVAIQVILLLLVEGLCFAVTGHWWLLNFNQQAWWLGILFLISISLQEKYAALLNGSHLYTQCNKTILFCNLLSLALFAFFFFVLKTNNVFFYLTLYILTNSLLAFSLLFVSKHRLHFSIDFAFSRKVLSVFFSYSLLVFVTNLIQFVAYRADLWLIAFFRNETEVGLYALAMRLVQLFWTLPLLFASIIFPKVSSRQDDYKHDDLLFLLRMLNAFNLVAGLGAFFCIKPLLVLIVGAQYSPGVPAFQILLPGIILFSNATVLAAYFAGMNMLKVNLWGSVLCLVSVGMLDLALIPGSGFIGAAVASTIGYSLTAVYFIFIFCKKRNLSFVHLFLPQKKDWQHLQSFGKNLRSKKQ